jgi:hypothetical protein
MNLHTNNPLKINTLDYRGFIIFHLLFGLINPLILFTPIDLPMGWRIFLLALGYNLAYGVWVHLKRQTVLFDLWLFLLPLSIFQVFPDWFLSAQLHILVFPEDGFYKIGTVSAYMAFLWVIPLNLAIFSGLTLPDTRPIWQKYGLVALISLIIFGISEETIWMLPSWYAQNVKMISHTAIYVLIPEIILGMTAFYAFLQVKEKDILRKIIAAYLVMLIYTGALMFFYFFVEKL